MSSNLENTIEMLSNEESIEVSHSDEAFYLNAEFWVGVAFVLVVALIYKPAVRIINNLITKRIDRIKNEFQEAETLKLDAQKTYAEYERKLENVEKEVQDIVEGERLVIEELKEQKIKELNRKLNQKQKEFDGKVSISLENINKEINGLIINKSMDILKDAFKLKLTKANYNSLIDKSILNLSKINIKN